MLDLSIPWHSILMMRPDAVPPPPPALPDGYSLRPYQRGDGLGWAEIESSVLEFKSVDEALECHRHYLPFEEELAKRQWFVIAPNGRPAATATGWWMDSPKGRVPCVHALACRPEEQGQGLGTAVATEMLRSLHRLHPWQAVWLDTQTWSWKAVGLYLRLGFHPMKEAVYSELQNDYALSLPLLRQKLDEETYRLFLAMTI